jgi:hypothetical protein
MEQVREKERQEEWLILSKVPAPAISSTNVSNPRIWAVPGELIPS